MNSRGEAIGNVGRSFFVLEDPSAFSALELRFFQHLHDNPVHFGWLAGVATGRTSLVLTEPSKQTFVAV